jgi:prevent-host-death family protein
MKPTEKTELKFFWKPGKPATIPAGEFKTHCLELMDQVQDRGFEIVITKRGKPVAKLAPFEEKRQDIFGYMKGTVSILGDIVGPTGEIWDADA